MVQTARQRFIYILADFISTNIAWFVFNIIRYLTLPYNYGYMTLSSYLSMPIVVIGQCLFPLMMILLFSLSGYYNKVFFKSRLDDVLNALGVSLIGTLIIFFTALFNDKIDDRLGNFEIILILWGLFFFLAAIPRLLITASATRKIWRRKIAFNVLIHGNTPHVLSLARDLEYKYKNMGFRVVGFISDKKEIFKDSEFSHLPVHKLSDVESAISTYDINSFIIDPDKESTQSVLSVINRLLPFGKSVYMTPDTYMYIASRPKTSMVAGQVLIDISSADIPQSTLNIKRLSDIIFASIALIMLSPVYAVIALLIKLDSPGPIIYKQERIGYKKKSFNIYKFRSMRVDAEAAGPALSSDKDTRITKIGKTLRKYRLDELPQFWNVVKGDMSIVGPRPERQFFFKQIIERAPYYTLVHQVKPGITSWGMVKYGYASSVDEMIVRMKYDLLYVENVSFAVDLKILFYTVITVITGKGI